MKFAIVIPDGAADEPLAELGGKTPLQVAQLPHMDAIAQAGLVGAANNVPAHLPAGSDVANMSLLGYDPDTYFSGRAPLEAAAQGVPLGPDDWAIRCNLVTVQDQIMREFTAGHISTEEGRELLAALQSSIDHPKASASEKETLPSSAQGEGALEFIAGVSYRNLLIYRPASKRDPNPAQTSPSPFTRDTRSTPPHDLTDQSVVDDYPRGPGADLLVHLMEQSVGVFKNHPVNIKRIANGKPPATNVWLWGLGKRPALAPFQQLYGKTGAMISAVDLLFGLAELIGWKRIQVPGATGYLDTDYAAKGRYAIDALDHYDVVCVHVEAPDEASHMGNAAEKIKALERIDADIVAPLHAAIKERGDYRILISPDHPTTIRSKTHSHGLVPFAVCGTGVPQLGHVSYDELQAAQGGISFPKGSELMASFLGKAPFSK